MRPPEAAPFALDTRAHAAELMKLAAEAIATAADRLDDRSFSAAVDLVRHATGKIVTSGAGTSGIIARKLAATFTSTGTPATFLHPADALHGALGLVDGHDVAIMISNGGESDELLTFLPYLRNRGVPLIAIVGNVHSSLARHAQVVLDAYAPKEACPHNLAPTSSTSVALAIGDALAITVMEHKGVTPEGFAQNHPSGRLGRRLTLRVADVMHADERPRVRRDTTLFEVIAAISAGGLGAVTVEDADGALLGLITDGDLRRAVGRVAPDQLLAQRADEMMTAAPITVGADTMAYDAMQIMENRPSQISVLPVVDADGHCLGLIRLHDLVKSGL